MESRVQKWGNSLAVRIPSVFAKELGISDDSPVEISLADGDLIVHALSAEIPTLEELLEQVTEENRHGEVDWGPPMGREVW